MQVLSENVTANIEGRREGESRRAQTISCWQDTESNQTRIQIILTFTHSVLYMWGDFSASYTCVWLRDPVSLWDSRLHKKRKKKTPVLLLRSSQFSVLTYRLGKLGFERDNREHNVRKIKLNGDNNRGPEKERGGGGVRGGQVEA